MLLSYFSPTSQEYEHQFTQKILEAVLFFRGLLQYGEAKMTIFATLEKDVKFASTSFLQSIRKQI